jgi:hypothetical protein
MKFIKITINHTEQEVGNIISEFDSVSLNFIEELYSNQKHIEFDLEDGRGVMYAEMEENQVSKLLSIYVKYGLDFSYEDITKSVLFGNVPFVNEEKCEELKALIKIFIEDNLDTDTVLDKISEMGIESISEQDKKVLVVQSA